MANILRIKDWNRLYENNRTRDLKRMEWVPIPNKMDGDGYTELVDHTNGAAHLGVWVATLQIASRCDPRGTLLRDRERAHTPQSLARISRLPVKLFEEAIPRFVQIGWLEIASSSNDTEIPHLPAEIPHDDVISLRRSDYGMEWNGMEPLNPCSTVTTVERDESQFLLSKVIEIPDQKADIIVNWFNSEFWPAYPRHEAKAAGLKAVRAQLKTPHLRSDAMAGLQKQLPELRAREPRMIPLAATWINGRRWEDEQAEGDKARTVADIVVNDYWERTRTEE